MKEEGYEDFEFELCPLKKEKLFFTIFWRYSFNRTFLACLENAFCVASFFSKFVLGFLIFYRAC